MSITSAYLIKASNRRGLEYAVGTAVLLLPQGDSMKWLPSPENENTVVVFSQDTPDSQPDFTFFTVASLITKKAGKEEYKLTRKNEDTKLSSRFMILTI